MDTIQFTLHCSLNCVLQKDMEVLTPGPVNVTVFGNRIFADDRVNITVSLLKKRNLGTEICTQRERQNEGRHWGDASPNRETPKTARKLPESKREAWNGLPHSLPKEPTLLTP